ncbi:MAG: hypothetical protein KDE20_27115, partial [Caldilineaceae bacterium]|nr:hypothetical protein [Caldilineaceae bacterium]
AAARLVHAGELVAAADLYAEHALFFRAGRLYEEAGAMAQAAAAYARDEEQPSSWRKAAALYLEHDDPAAAAALLERTGDWVDAAQAWEQAGALAKAADVYAADLNEPHKAAQLYRDAGMPLAAAELLAAAGEYAAAIDLLVAADAKAHAGKIRTYRRRLLDQGDRRALGDLLAEAAGYEERAEIYMSIEEWTKAAEVLAEGGNWELAVELLLDRKRLDHAIALLERRAEPAAQAQLAGLLCKQLRWREAHGVYHTLGDRESAAVCLEKLGRYSEAAQRLEELASAREAPRLSQAEEMDLGALFDRAARLYRAEFRRADFERCKRKANHYMRRPWLVLEIVPPRAIYVERANVLAVVIANQSRGIAYDVKL